MIDQWMDQWKHQWVNKIRDSKFKIQNSLKFCKFKFENVDECKNHFPECLQRKADGVPLAQISERLLDFLPETISLT